MRLISLIIRILAISIILLLPACTPKNDIPQESLTGVSELVTESPVPSPQLGNPSGNQTTPINDPYPTPNGMIGQQLTSPPGTDTETQESPEIAWREVPIMPEVSQHILQIYQEGQAQGRNPHNFSVIGDCQSIPYVFLGPLGRGVLEPGSTESYLWDAINQFKDSFNRWSVTSRGGFTAASILNPLQADPHYCKSGETPLTCEYRLNNPAYAFITLETWLDPNTIDRYETYLRQILDYVIGHGTIPILLTKADSSEVLNGKYVINPAIVRVARDYDIPVVNFWRSAQYLPNGGIDPAREGFHLSQDGYNLKNILALRALYNIWQAVQHGSTNGSTGLANPTSTPTQQAPSHSESAPVVTVPDCEGGCIFFATAASHDGAVTSQGVYAYAYRDKNLTQVLGEGFDLQDVSKDGQRLLVNKTNRLYEINLASDSAILISESFFSFGEQDAYWNSDASAVIFIDQNHPFQTETGGAFNLFPSTRDEERYFEIGSCSSKDYCQSSGIYRLDPDQSTTRLDSFSRPVFSPDGKLVAYLNPAAATKDNYYHIGYLLLEEPDRGISSRRVFYFPEEGGFMVYPDVRDYAFSPESNNLFIIYDVYSAYFERSLRIQTYMLDIKTGILYDYGSLSGVSGSLNPRLVWAPQGNMLLFFLTDETPDNKYSLSIFQTKLNSDERLTPYDQEIMTSNDYFYITNLYWR
jgi:hypothetical protein